MTAPRLPHLAIALLERFGPDREALVGDLIEEFERRQSLAWLWWQVLAAIAAASLEPAVEIRPLRLVDLQPVDAAERARRLLLRPRNINLTGTPVSGVGGITLLVLCMLVTIVAPGIWLGVLASILAGVVFGLALIRRHDGVQVGSTPIWSNQV
ncbi:MAG TPA: hypothetical protein VF198_09220 [Vicinamibacterales bacterium]